MNRVKVSYAVDIEDVPKVASYIYDEALLEIKGVVESMHQLDFQGDSIPVLSNKIHDIRSRLAKVDQRIDDCFAITAGYHEAVLNGGAQQEPNALPPEQVEQVRGMSEKISSLQRMMSTMAGEGSDGQ